MNQPRNHVILLLEIFQVILNYHFSCRLLVYKSIACFTFFVFPDLIPPTEIPVARTGIKTEGAVAAGYVGVGMGIDHCEFDEEDTDERKRK